MKNNTYENHIHDGPLRASRACNNNNNNNCTAPSKATRASRNNAILPISNDYVVYCWFGRATATLALTAYNTIPLAREIDIICILHPWSFVSIETYSGTGNHIDRFEYTYTYRFSVLTKLCRGTAEKPVALGRHRRKTSTSVAYYAARLRV